MRFSLAMFCWILSSCTGWSVMIGTGDGTGNTTGTGAGSGWNYVGTINWPTGVYLGEYGGGNWVLTANHVGVADFTLNGITYNPVGPGIQINGADLLVFRINGDPGLPNLALSSTRPVDGSDVILIGNGYNREVALTTWYVDTDVSPYVWSETWFPEADEIAEGYKYGSGTTKRWGSNKVSGASFEGDLNTWTVQTRFIDDDGTNSQAVHGDSGGGMFYFNGTDWELSGIMISKSPFSGEPANIAVYGGLSYMADVAIYRDAILAVVPEPSVISLVILGVLTAIAGRGMRRRR